MVFVRSCVGLLPQCLDESKLASGLLLERTFVAFYLMITFVVINADCVRYLLSE
ncbi:hypothetical protein Hdeb2414_s0006g00198681 [Helianthus debilis subsp. tardiflorus]